VNLISSVSPISGDANDKFTYSVVLEYRGNSRTTCYDFNLNYTFPPELIFDFTDVVACIYDGPLKTASELRIFNCTGVDLSTFPYATSAEYFFPFLELGQRFHALMNATAVQTVEPQQVLINEIAYRFDRNPSPQPDTSRVYNFNNIQTTLIDSPVVLLSVMENLTSDPTTVSPQMTIEETFQVSVRLTMPEAVTNTSIQVIVPPGIGLRNAMVNSIGFRMFQSHVNQGDQLNSSQYFYLADDTMILDFGQLENRADNIKDSGDELEVVLEMIVLNIPSNIGFTSRPRVRASVFFNITRSVSTQLYIDVVEPLLTNTITTTLQSGQPDAGDVLLYTLNLRHNQSFVGITAYQATTMVPVPSSLILNDTSMTAFIGANPLSVVLVNESYFMVTDFTLLPTEMLVITYRAQIIQGVRPNEVITTRLFTTWTSVPSTSPFPGRQHVNASRPYPWATNQHSITILSPTIVTTLLNTSVSQTIDPFVNIGEVAVFFIRAAFPEAVMNTTVLITLSSGLIYRSARVVSIGQSLENSLLNVDDAPSVTGNLLRFSFGVIQDTFNNTVNANDQLTLAVQCQVADIPQNTRNTVLSAAATLIADTTSTSSTATITVVQPNLTLAVTPMTTFTNRDGLDTVLYFVNLSHTALTQSAAFDLRVTVTVGAFLNITSMVNASLAGAVAEPISADSKSLAWTLDTLTTSQSLLLYFIATVQNTVAPATPSIVVSASMTCDSLPGSEFGLPGRAYSTSAVSVPVTIPNPTASLVPSSSSVNTTTFPLVAVEEAITMAFTLSMPEVTSSLTTLRVTVPNNRLSYVNLSITYGRISCAQASTFVNATTMFIDFGACMNQADNIANANDLFVVFVTYLVTRDVANVQNATFTINSAWTYVNGLASTVSLANSYNLTVVEPKLTISISTGSAITNLDGGDNVTYTITLAHTAQSRTDAYDVIVTAVVGNFQNITFAAASSLSQVPTRSNKLVTWNVGRLGFGVTLTASFTATLLNSVFPNTQSIFPVATSTFDSIPALTFNNATLGGRPDSVSANFTALTIRVPTFAFAPVNSSHTFTALNDVTINEAVTFGLTITVPEVTTNLTATLTVPTGLMSIRSYSLQRNGVSCGPETATSATASLSLNFGTCINAFDNIVSANDNFVVLFSTVVTTNALNVNNATLRVNATSTYTNGFQQVIAMTPQSATLTIREPTLSISITNMTSIINQDAGDTSIYEIVVQHIGPSAAAAFDLTVTGAVGAFQNITLGSPGTQTSEVIVSPDKKFVTWTLSNLTLGTVFRANFTAVVLNSVMPATTGITARANCSFDSVPGLTLGDVALGGRTAMVSRVSNALTIPVPTTTFAPFNTSNPLTDLPNVTVDEIVTYAQAITLPEVSTSLTASISVPLGLVAIRSYSLVFGSGVHCEPELPLPTSNTLMLTLNNCVNTFNNVAGAGDVLTVYWAVVPVKNALNTNGISRQVSVSSTFVNGSLQVVSMTPGSSSFTIREPRLSIAFTAVSGVSNLDAGDTTLYALEVRHTAASTAAAFDLTVTGIVGNFQSVTLAPLAPLSTNVAISPNGKIASWTLSDLPLSAVFRANFTATVLNTVFPATPGIVAQINCSFDSAPGFSALDPLYGGRPDSVSNTSLAITIAQPTMAFAILNTSSNFTVLPAVTIHEGVTYAHTVRLPEVSTLVSTFLSLPSSRMAIQSFWVQYGSNINCSQQVATFGSLNQSLALNFGLCMDRSDNVQSTADNIVVYVNAFALNVGSNVNNATLLANASSTFQTGVPQNVTLSNVTTVRVVEPKLSVSVVALTPVATLDGGSNVTYQLTVQHTAASQTAALDVSVVATVGAYQTIVQALPSLPISDALTVSANGKTVTWSLGQYLLNERVFNANFTAMVLNNVRPATTGILAAAACTFDSVPLLTYSDPWLTGRIETVNANSAPLVIAQPSADMFVSGTSDVKTLGLAVAINERVFHTLVVSLPHVTSLLHTVFRFPSNQMSAIGASIVISPAVNCTPTWSVSSFNGLDDTLTVDFGTCVVALTDMLVEQINITVESIVLDDDRNVLSVNLTTFANCSHSFDDSGFIRSYTLNDTVMVTEPDYQLRLSQEHTQYLMRNQTINLSLAVTPSFGDSVTLFVYVPRYLTVQTVTFDNSTAASVGPVTSDTMISSTNTTLTYTFGSVFSNSTIALWYVLSVDADAPPGIGLDVTSMITYKSSPEAMRGRRGNATAAYNTIYVVYLNCSMSVASAFAAVSLPQVAIGDLLSFTLDCGVRGTYPLVLSLPSLMNARSQMWSFQGSSVTYHGSRVLLNTTLSPVVDAQANLVLTVPISNMLLSRTIDAQDSFRVTLVYAVLNTPNVAAAVVASTAPQCTFGGLVFDALFSFEVVEPVMQYNVSLSPSSSTLVEAGSVLTFALFARSLNDVATQGSSANILVLSNFTFANISTLTTPTDSPASALTTWPNAQRSLQAVLLPGQMWLLTVQVRVDDSVLPGIGFSHNVSFSFASSPQIGSRAYSLDATTLDSASLDVRYNTAFVSFTNYGPALLRPTIGDNICAHYNITLPRVTSPATVLRLHYPTALRVISNTIVSMNGVVSLAGAPRWTFNTTDLELDLATIRFASFAAGTGVVHASVCFSIGDEPAVQRTSVLTVQSQLNYSTSQQSFSGLTDISIELPYLEQALIVTPDTGDSGDLVTLTHRVWHGSNSSSDAYQLLINMTATDFFDFLPATSNYNQSTGENGGPVSCTAQLCRFSSNVLRRGAVMTMTYQLRLNDRTLPGQTVSFIGNLFFKSAATPAGRVYQFPVSNTYQTTSMPPTSFTSTSVVSGTYPHPFPNAIAIGEVITSSLVLTLIEGTSANLTIAAQYPLMVNATTPSLAFISVVVTRRGSNLLSQIPPVTIYPYSDDSTSSVYRSRRTAISPTLLANHLVVDLGTIVNNWDNTLDANDTLTVAFSAVLLDSPVNTNLKQVTLGSLSDSVDSAATASQTLTILEPMLELTAQWVPSANARAVALQVIVKHINESFIEAQGLSLNFTFASNTTFDFGLGSGRNATGLLTVPENMTFSLPIVLSAATTSEQRTCTNVTLFYTGPNVGSVFPPRAYIREVKELCYAIPSTSTTPFLATIAGILLVVGAIIALVCTFPWFS
jgi:hypothetical protein